MSDMEKAVQVEPVRGSAGQDLSASEHSAETDNESDRYQSVLAETLGFVDDPMAKGKSMGDHDIEHACDNTGKADLEKFALEHISDALPGKTKSYYVRLIRKHGLHIRALSRTEEDVIVFMATTSPSLPGATEDEALSVAAAEATAAESTATAAAIAAATTAADAAKAAAIAAAEAQYVASLKGVRGDEEVAVVSLELPLTPKRRPATDSGSSPSSVIDIEAAATRTMSSQPTALEMARANLPPADLQLSLARQLAQLSAAKSFKFESGPLSDGQNTEAISQLAEGLGLGASFGTQSGFPLALCAEYIKLDDVGSDVVDAAVLAAQSVAPSDPKRASDILNSAGFTKCIKGVKARARVDVQEAAFCRAVSLLAKGDPANLTRPIRLRELRPLADERLSAAMVRSIQAEHVNTGKADAKQAINDVTARGFDFDSQVPPQVSAELLLGVVATVRVNCKAANVNFPMSNAEILVAFFTTNSSATTIEGKQQQGVVARRVEHSVMTHGEDSPETCAALIAEFPNIKQSSNRPDVGLDVLGSCSVKSKEVELATLQEKVKQQDRQIASFKSNASKTSAAAASVRTAAAAAAATTPEPVASEAKPTTCHGCGSSAHRLVECPTTPKVAGTDGTLLNSMICRNCKCNGHKKVNCPTLPKNGQGSSVSVDAAATAPL